MKIKLSNIKKNIRINLGKEETKIKKYKDKTKNKEQRAKSKETVLISFIKKGKLEKK